MAVCAGGGFQRTRFASTTRAALLHLVNVRVDAVDPLVRRTRSPLPSGWRCRSRTRCLCGSVAGRRFSSGPRDANGNAARATAPCPAVATFHSVTAEAGASGLRSTKPAGLAGLATSSGTAALGCSCGQLNALENDQASKRQERDARAAGPASTSSLPAAPASATTPSCPHTSAAPASASSRHPICAVLSPSAREPIPVQHGSHGAARPTSSSGPHFAIVTPAAGTAKSERSF